MIIEVSSLENKQIKPEGGKLIGLRKQLKKKTIYLYIYRERERVKVKLRTNRVHVSGIIS